MGYLGTERQDGAVRGRFPVTMGPLLWPLSADRLAAARRSGYALLALVLCYAVCVAFDRYYWADYQQVREPYGLGRLAVPMAPTLLATGAVLVSAVAGGRGRVAHRILVGLAWAVSLVAVPYLMLLMLLGGVDLCKTPLPPMPADVDPGVMVPVCTLVALVAASLVSALATAVPLPGGRRLHPVGGYLLQVSTAAVTVFVLLAPVLHASPTCQPTMP